MKCPICGFEVNDINYWYGDRCLRCVLTTYGTANMPNIHGTGKHPRGCVCHECQKLRDTSTEK